MMPLRASVLLGLAASALVACGASQPVRDHNLDPEPNPGTSDDPPPPRPVAPPDLGAAPQADAGRTGGPAVEDAAAAPERDASPAKGDAPPASAPDAAAREDASPFIVKGDLPAPWSSRDVGPVKLPGSAAFKDGAFTLTANGKDVWHEDDFYHFVHQPLDGDGEIVARIVALEPGTGGSWGVMMRNQPVFDNPDVPGIMVFWSPGEKSIIWADRTKNAGGGAGSGWGPFPFVKSAATLPHWVKIVRQGNRWTGYHSADGKTWEDIAPSPGGHKATNTIVNTTQRVWIGLFGCPHSDTKYGRATFDNVTVTKK